jgi:hypothetical protein
MELNLASMCFASFAAVFTVLAFLAITMRLIMIIFPVKEAPAGGDDAAIYAAVTSTYSRLYPGMKITNIQEKK